MLRVMQSYGVFARDDTIFGVCEGLGQDFGFNPNLLRALIGVGMLLSPFTAAAAYAAFAVLVAVSRWLVPDVAPSPPEADERLAGEDALNDQAQAWEEMAIAA